MPRKQLTFNESLAEEKRLKRLQAEFKECLSTYELSRERTDAAGRTEVQAFIETGLKMQEIKTRLDRGKWLDWVASNFKINKQPRSVDTARRFIRGAAWAQANAERVPHIISVAMLMRLCGEDRRQLVKPENVFTLATAIKLIAPAAKLNIDAVRQWPTNEQQELRARLEPVHRIYMALPEPTEQPQS